MMMLPFPTRAVRDAFGQHFDDVSRQIKAAWKGCAVLALVVLIADVVIAIV